MKKTCTSLFVILILLFFVTNVNAQNNFFTDINESLIGIAGQHRVIVPEKYRVISLDTTAFKIFLQTVPSDKNIINQNEAPILTIPLPDGNLGRFHIWQSSVMEPGLAAKFSDIKTYTGQGIDDRTATIKIDWTEFGFHAMILSPVTTSIFIDPYAFGDKLNYISYLKSDCKPGAKFIEAEPIINKQLAQGRPASPLANPLIGQCIGGTMRAYRLAIACTHQYAMAATNLNTPTVAQTLSAIITSINRVDGVYEEEVDIHFNLVTGEDNIIFTSAATDPFTANDDATQLIPQSQHVIDANIGDASYDVGHTFSTGAGGLTEPGVVCISGEKASSVTGLSDPVGDVYNIDYVAHEIGHEFNAHHPFNSDMSYCGASGQGSPTTNVEPGSGSTIMAYAEDFGGGTTLCGTDNLQAHSDAYFNGINFDEITTYADNSNCAVISTTGNTPPVVNAGTNYTVPVSTPFVLTGSATDIDNDSLTYCWEQIDVGGPNAFGPWNMPTGNAPIFRSFLPVSVPYRYFPKLSDVINNTTTIGEIMSSYPRILHFRLTVRDNHAGGGGICFGEDTITVSGSAPFLVTYPDTTGIVWKVGEMHTVTWDTANTQSSPFNCSNVIIQLSTDGGLTYPDTLLASTPNNGSAQIQVPDAITNSARIRVMAVGNVFYDISNNNFTLQAAAVLPNWTVYMEPGEVNLGSNINDANAEVQLFDASGRLVLTKNIGGVTIGQVTSISLISFARGVYILKMNSSTHGTQHKEIIVR
jgi:hypothetical protein